MVYPTAKEVIEDNPDATNKELANQWMVALDVNDVARLYLLQSVAEHFRVLRRGMVREIEVRVFRKGGKPVDPDTWKTMLDSQLDIRIGKRILIGDATIQDWEERIAFLESSRNGIEDSMDRARAAIRILEIFNVRTLRDVPQEHLPEHTNEERASTDHEN